MLQTGTLNGELTRLDLDYALTLRKETPDGFFIGRNEDYSLYLFKEAPTYVDGKFIILDRNRIPKRHLEIKIDGDYFGAILPGHFFILAGLIHVKSLEEADKNEPNLPDNIITNDALYYSFLKDRILKIDTDDKKTLWSRAKTNLEGTDPTEENIEDEYLILFNKAFGTEHKIKRK